ncbi:MAG: FtsW/RodA/SpoVE family cell cycle protein [Anaerovoracaceae bacterium]|nr:FtsW/RodA/SpoVE family cell cycle protein [Anaerovoracaceae bacterium]
MKYLKNLFEGTERSLYLMPLVFFVISMLMMLSTSYDNGIVISKTVVIQGVAYVLGFVIILFMANIDYETFQDIQVKLYVGSIIFLLLVYVPGLGVEMNGARSWINLGVTTFQPSEIVKITFILLMADYFRRHKVQLRTFGGVLKSMIYAAPFILIILKEDLGSALVFMIIYVVMLFYAGISYKLFGELVAVVALLTPVAYSFLADYQKERITAFLHPNNLSLQGNYQVWQSKVAIGSGGFFGKGLFHGTQKALDFLPVSNSDYVFAVLCEELGFLGGFLLIAAYAYFIYGMTKVATRAIDEYGALVVIGVIAMFTFQIFENIAMTMGIMPATGITLPFISYGGSSVLCCMLALGLVLNVAIKNKNVTF